jgi:hypothetical protein
MLAPRQPVGQRGELLLRARFLPAIQQRGHGNLGGDACGGVPGR